MQHPENLTVTFTRYIDNLALAVRLLITDEDYHYEEYATLSINVEPISDELPDDEFVVKAYSENTGLDDLSLYRGLFEDTGKRVRVSQFVTAAPIWRVTDKSKVPSSRIWD